MRWLEGNFDMQLLMSTRSSAVYSPLFSRRYPLVLRTRARSFTFFFDSFALINRGAGLLRDWSVSGGASDAYELKVSERIHVCVIMGNTHFRSSGLKYSQLG